MRLSSADCTEVFHSSTLRLCGTKICCVIVVIVAAVARVIVEGVARERMSGENGRVRGLVVVVKDLSSSQNVEASLIMGDSDMVLSGVVIALLPMS